MTTERSRAPKNPTGWKEPLSFRVWAEMPLFLEDKRPWKLAASFRYLQEALDYIESVKRRGATVVFQSPADCRTITPDA